MTDDTPLPFDLPSVSRKKLTVDFNGGTQSSDGGLLLLRAAERKLGVCERLAAAMPDRRDPNRIEHEMIEMVMARSSAIASGYEDAIDFDPGADAQSPAGFGDVLLDGPVGNSKLDPDLQSRLAGGDKFRASELTRAEPMFGSAPVGHES
jgi:Transposase DDE domain group 1